MPLPITTLSDSDMIKLKKELNFLLWTNNPPPIPAGYRHFSHIQVLSSEV